MEKFNLYLVRPPLIRRQAQHRFLVCRVVRELQMETVLRHFLSYCFLYWAVKINLMEYYNTRFYATKIN